MIEVIDALLKGLSHLKTFLDLKDVSPQHVFEHVENFSTSAALPSYSKHVE
jgi:hypothetical protein